MQTQMNGLRLLLSAAALLSSSLVYAQQAAQSPVQPPTAAQLQAAMNPVLPPPRSRTILRIRRATIGAAKC